MRIWKWLKERWRWYILGRYHCDRCPYAWEERYYEGDCDCGCVIRGDIRDTCRLIPPFRGIIGWFKRNAAAYSAEHEYDGLEDWIDKDVAGEKAIKEAVRKGLGTRQICYQDTGGYWKPVGDFYTDSICHTIRDEYDKVAHPIVHQPLMQRWKELLKDTWERSPFFNIVPYFYQRKKRRYK